jgi:hypothetical protein
MKGQVSMRTLHWASLVAAIAMVLAILVLPAFAQPRSILPPAQYDYPYEGDLAIKIVDSLDELRDLCRLSNRLACSTHTQYSCLIVMVNDETMRRHGYTTGMLFRHEQGHCNGWGADHAGERIPPPAAMVPSHLRPTLPPPGAPSVTIRAKDPSRLP